MPNVSRVNGFKPVRTINGAPWNGRATRYFIPSNNATNTFMYDYVKLDGTSDITAFGGKGKGVRSVVQAAAGDPLVGSIVGFEIDPNNLNTPQYRAASTGRYVWVADDPNLLFEGQDEGNILGNDVGLNANIIVFAGSTITGASGMQIGTKGTTANLQLKLMEYVQREDNDPLFINGKILVKINNHQLAASTGTAGV